VGLVDADAEHRAVRDDGGAVLGEHIAAGGRCGGEEQGRVRGGVGVHQGGGPPGDPLPLHELERGRGPDRPRVVATQVPGPGQRDGGGTVLDLGGFAGGHGAREPGEVPEQGGQCGVGIGGRVGELGDVEGAVGEVGGEDGGLVRGVRWGGAPGGEGQDQSRQEHHAGYGGPATQTRSPAGPHRPAGRRVPRMPSGSSAGRRAGSAGRRAGSVVVGHHLVFSFHRFHGNPRSPRPSCPLA